MQPGETTRQYSLTMLRPHRSQYGLVGPASPDGSRTKPVAAY